MRGDVIMSDDIGSMILCTKKSINIIKQIMFIRETGKTNMLENRNVLELAKKYKFNELVEFIKTEPKQYRLFIMTGRMVS